MATTYNSGSAYIETATSLKEKIAKIDALQTALLNTAMRSVENGDVEEYTLDDGQSIIKCKYTSTDSITKAYKDYEQIRIMLINSLNGSIILSIDSRNIHR